MDVGGWAATLCAQSGRSKCVLVWVVRTLRVMQVPDLLSRWDHGGSLAPFHPFEPRRHHILVALY